MKFKVQSKALYTAISAVSKVINAKNAMTILNNFLFDVDGETLTITALDLENVLSARVPVTDFEGEPGKFCIDARRSVELFKELPQLDVEFNVDENLGIIIDYPGGKFNFVGINGDEYPTAQQEESSGEPVEFTYPAQKFIHGIEQVIFAVGTDDIRPQMMGVLLDIKEDGITFVATDTHKLVKFSDKTVAPGVTVARILPVKPANIIKSTFTKDAQIKLILDEKSATFTDGNFTLNCRFIKGNFPPYERVIPQNNPYVLTVDRMSLLNAVRRVSVFVDPSHGLIKFKITPEQIEMKSQDSNYCTAGREVVACSFTGNEMIIGFGAPYLIEFCNTITTENIIVQLADPSRPGVFLPEENEPDTELLMLLMPMQVNNY